MWRRNAIASAQMIESASADSLPTTKVVFGDSSSATDDAPLRTHVQPNLSPVAGAAAQCWQQRHTHPDDDDMAQSSCPCRPATQSASASDAMLLGLLGSGSGSSTAGITCGLAALDIIVRWPTGPGALLAGTYSCSCRGTGAGATDNRGAWCRGKEARGNTSPPLGPMPGRATCQRRPPPAAAAAQPPPPPRAAAVPHSPPRRSPSDLLVSCAGLLFICQVNFFVFLCTLGICGRRADAQDNCAAS
jgi:hypothetical protein